MKRRRLSTDAYLPLLLSATGAFGVFPFAVLRFLRGEWLLGLLDTLIVAGLVGLGLYVWRSKRVRLPSLCISVLCIVGVIATIYVKGPAQIFWVYPVLLALFYLLRPGEAVLAGTGLLLTVSPALLGAAQGFVTITVIITLLVTVAFAYAFSAITHQQREQLMRMATRDPLTGAGNRRALEDQLAASIASHRRTQTPASMLVIDLDHFKAINDRHGHTVGDRILVGLTEVIRDRIRSTDHLFRVGGEEFVIVTEGNTLEMAARLADLLRELVEGSDLAGEGAVTVSIGVAELGEGESESDWFRRADNALYQAKSEGRNRTCVAA